MFAIRDSRHKYLTLAGLTALVTMTPSGRLRSKRQIFCTRRSNLRLTFPTAFETMQIAERMANAVGRQMYVVEVK